MLRWFKPGKQTGTNNPKCCSYWWAMWFIIRKARLEILHDSQTCETKCYLCRETEENPYRINDSFASRCFSIQWWKRLGQCGRWWSHSNFRPGVEITQGGGAKPEYSFALTVRSMSTLLPGYLAITFLQMDFGMFFLRLQNDHFKIKY